MKNKAKILFLGLMVSVMSGCTFGIASNSSGLPDGPVASLPGGSEGTSTGGASTGGISAGGGTSAGGDDVNGSLTDHTRIRTVNEQIGWSTLESVGNQKMLVIPVQLSNGPTWTSAMLTNLNKVFFGTSNDVNWQSVSSFYHESSYGKLTISGEVATPFVSSKTISNVQSKGEGSSDYIIGEWYATADTAKLKEYDQDSDGFVDCAVFIYSNAHGNSGAAQEAFWAWCFYYDVNPKVSRPTINNYMWAGYDFMNDEYQDGYNSSKVDAHTFIHESGHLLGLDDYYCYDSTSPWDAAGELEMQAYNVGDQNIYSKIALGWVDPVQVRTTTSQTITLDTSATEPQAIILNDSWNGSAFDEYLVLEYYTPTGLNETDALHAFDSRDKMYTYNGLRLYHVDARLAKLSYNDYTRDYEFVSYVDRIGSDDYTYYVGASNSYSWSYLSGSNAKNYRYVHLLDQGGSNALNGGKGGTVYANTALWTAGHTFTPSSKFFANGANFNDGSKIGYSIAVNSLTSTQATITITKI